MQVPWCEVFKGNRPMTVDELLFYYKSSEIKQSVGFYQFSFKGPQFSLIRGRSSQVMEERVFYFYFYFLFFGNWAGDPSDVNNAPFPPFTNALGRLRLEGMSFILYFIFSIYFFPRLTKFFICEAITRSHLDKFQLERIDRACAHPERSFHSLVTFRHLAIWGLGPEPIVENLAHEETTRRSKCHPSSFIHFF